MIVSAVVGLGHADGTARIQTGQAIPAPVHVRALLDTGSSTTAVAPFVFAQLGLTSLITGSSQTASGSVAVNLHYVSLSIFDATRSAMLTVRDLLVSELTSAIPDTDMLIGMDVLLGCRLLLDGPARRFALEF
jgi:hypothetical protein